MQEPRQFRVEGLGFNYLRFRVQALRFMVLGFKVKGFRFRVQGEFRVPASKQDSDSQTACSLSNDKQQRTLFGICFGQARVRVAGGKFLWGCNGKP